MSQFKRLCIDARIRRHGAADLRIIQELVGAFASADSEHQDFETVLLSQPGLEFEGQLPRFDTKRRIGHSLLYPYWEKGFIHNAELSLFHRFRTADHLDSFSSTPTVTTVLPTEKPPRLKAIGHPNQRFVVPSAADRERLTEIGIAPERIHLVPPCIRQRTHEVGPQEPKGETIVFLTGDSSESQDYRRMAKVLSERFPTSPRKFISLDDEKMLSGEFWIKLLGEMKLCFYLTARPFDWPTLALETLYCKIPTLFHDKHAALSELLPNSKLHLSGFLLNELSEEEIKKEAKSSSEKLEAAGVFNPERLAEDYGKLYRELV